MAQSNKTFTNRLKNLFGIGMETSKVSQQSTVVPAKKDPGKKTTPKNISLPPDLDKLYKLWLSDVFEDSNSLKNRFNRYSSLQFAWYNNSIFSMTVDLFADETPQADQGETVILVDAKDTKVKKYIDELFTRLKIDAEEIRNLAWDVCLYGDAFRITPVEAGTGIQDFVALDVFSVKDRFEFKASEANKKMNKNKAMKNYSNKNKKIQKMLDQFNEKDAGSLADFFKTYLFGFELDGDLIIPPWYMSHFRLQTQQSEFWPFGRSLMINSLGPFRQLQSSKNLMALARGSNFPIKHFEVEIDRDTDPASAWEAVDEAREEYHNLANTQAGSEEFVINSEIWTASGQLNFTQIDPNLNLDQIADVEYLRDELIMGTRVPKGYLIVDKGSFGTSGQALLRQHKPFSRAVFRIQSTILKALTEMVRLHFAATGDFDYEEPFELSMNFPEVEESRDRISAKNDTLRLAKDVLDNIGTAIGLGRDEALPPEVVKQVFSQLSFISSEDVEAWVDASVDAIPKDDDSGDKGGFFNNYMRDKKNVISEDAPKYVERISDDLIRDIYFNTTKELNFTEGVRTTRHFYNSNDRSINYKEKIILDMFKQEVDDLENDKQLVD